MSKKLSTWFMDGPLTQTLLNCTKLRLKTTTPNFLDDCYFLKKLKGLISRTNRHLTGISYI